MENHHALIANNDGFLRDLQLFCTVALRSSFITASTETGISPSHVSKRIALLEATLGVKLFSRTTRRVTITSDGEAAFQWAQKILDDVQGMTDALAGPKGDPRGLIRISTSLRLGREHVSPILSLLRQKFGGLEVWLELLDRRVDLVSESFDIDVRVGEVEEPHLIPHKIVDSARILCAAPAYLARRGAPQTLRELETHDCLPIKERDLPFGVWRLRGEGEEGVVKVNGPLSTNHGEIALQWAVAGAGIVLRSRWDAQAYLDRGELVQVLPAYTQEANVWAVYPQRLASSAKVRVFVDFLEQHLACDNRAPTKQMPHE